MTTHTEVIAPTHSINPATCAAVGWMVAVVAFIASAAANAAWGWEDSASLLYGVGGVALLASGALLVATQVAIGKRTGGLGALATIGIGVTALGALLSFVAWATVLWTTALGIGTLLFGLPLLRRNALPRPWGAVVTFALPAAAAVAWVGVVVLDAGAEDASNVVEATYLGLVAAAGLVLATGLAALGRWLRTD